MYLIDCIPITKILIFIQKHDWKKQKRKLYNNYNKSFS